MASNTLNEDEQLQMALQLSKQSYDDEQRRRRCESPDLMLGDPVEIERQKNIEEITAMFEAPTSAPSTPSVPPYLMPRSTAALPYGFHPQYSFNKEQNRFLPPPINLYAPVSSTPSMNRGFVQCPTLPSQLAPKLNASNSFASGMQSPFAAASSSASLGFPRSESAQPLSSLGTLNHTQIVVPFRTRDGNLIDLDDAPAALDESIVSQRDESITPEIPELQLDEILALIERSSHKPDSTPVIEPQPQSQKKSTQPKKMSTIVAAGKLEVIQKQNDFFTEVASLKAKTEKYRCRQQKEVFFIAQTVDYLTTTAESIKIKVHRDDTWPAKGESSQSVELTYEVTSTCEDLLIAVLCRFLPPESIGDQVKIEDFTLKVYGVDEFLDPKSVIGHHPFVGRFLASGKDVLLEIGKKSLRDVNFQYIPQFFKARELNTVVLEQKSLEKLITEFNSAIKVLDDSATYPSYLRTELVEAVIAICKFCGSVQTIEISSAIHTMKAVDVPSHYRHAKNNLLLAVYNLVNIYCDATLSEVNLKPLCPESQPTEIRESRFVNHECMILLESIHNVPTAWLQRYKQFYIELCLMHGTKSISITQRTEHKDPGVYHGMVTVPFSTWINTGSQIMLLPREVQTCIIVCGVLKDDVAATVQREAGGDTHEVVGFSSLPLFKHDSLMVQGKVLLPLQHLTRSIVQPWGPKPLIRNKSEGLIVLSVAEHLYKVQFPQNIEEEQLTPMPFSSLPKSQQSPILDLLERNISHNNLSTDDRHMLWSNRRALMKMSEAFVPILASAVSWDCLHLSNIYPLLRLWNAPEPQLVLDLLLPYFQDTYVRRRAIELIRRGSSEFLMSLLTQLVEALRFEIFEDSELAAFLLEQSIRDRRFATNFFWELEHRAVNESAPYSSRCRLLLDMLLDLDIPNFVIELSCQKNFCVQMDQICESVKPVSLNNAITSAQNALYEVNNKIMITGVRLPINPAFFATSIKVEDCGVFNSFTRPLRVNLVGQRSTYGVIYKIGDDLRQDTVVLQLVRLMNDIWLRENLDLRMLTYRVMPIAKSKGMIELVNDCKTLREVQMEKTMGIYKDNTIANWLSRHNPSEFNYRTAFDNFLRSCAGWCVATYVLGIGDRHNDNILLAKSGHVFHIDFGKYMGDWQSAMGINRDRVPFVLTPEMEFAINNGAKFKAERFQEFSDFCCKAYNSLRRNCGSLLNVIKFMSCSTVPNMNINAVSFVEKNLMLDYSEYEATTYFTQKIRASNSSIFPRMVFLAHTMAQMMSSGTNNGQNEQDKNNDFSFTTETYSVVTDGRIVKVLVPGFEKWRNPSKVYMFLCEVYRANEQTPTTVFRTFSECQELYNALVDRFNPQSLPVFDASTGFGRSNIRQVAEQRRLMLKNFFTRFFELSAEIVQCDLVYTFFHAIHRDTNPEVIKDVVYQNRSSFEAPSIHLTLTHVENTAELKIFISHARNLPLVGGITTNPPDSYVKTYVRSDARTHSKRKTEVVRNTCSPTYNAHISYTFDSVNEMQRAALEVSIWHASAAIVRDNYRFCGTDIPLAQLFDVIPDRKGIRTLSKWFTVG